MVKGERVAIDSSKFQAVASRKAVLKREQLLKQRLEQKMAEYLAAVDAAHGLIIHHAITNEAADNRQLQSMGETAKAILGQETLNVVADAGYSNGEQAAALEQAGILPHVPANRAVNNRDGGQLFDRRCFVYDDASNTLCCPAEKTLVRKQINRKDKCIVYTAQAHDCRHCPLKSRCTTRNARLVTRYPHEDALQRMHTRATPELMRLRRCTVEYPFGLLKFHILEKPRLLMRGLWGSGTEMALATLTYNLKRVMAVLGNAGMVARLVPA